MVEEISNPVTRRCNTGKMPAWMRKMKAQNSYSCDELATAVTGMVKDKRGRAKKAKAGKGDGSVLHLYGGDDWVWILATENDTRLRGLSGERYLIDPTAHMAALPEWLKVDQGHTDHKPENNSKIQISDARYDIDKGLYLRVRSDDEQVTQGLRSGSILPSIEVDVESEDVLDNNLIDCYSPTGLGLMVENEPMGNSVGPEKPVDRYSVPIYAGEINMDEKENVEEETKEKEIVESDTTEAQPEPIQESKDSETEEVDELTQLKAQNKELNDKLEDVLGQVDSKASAEEELKKIYLGKIPESIHNDVDKLDLPTLKAFAKLSDHFSTQLETTSSRLEEAPVINETDTVGSNPGITPDGKISDKLYYSLKIKQAEANGMKVPEEWRANI